MENSCRLAIQILFRIFEVGRAAVCKMPCFALLATWNRRREIEVSGQKEEAAIIIYFKIQVQVVRVQLFLVKR